MRKKGFEPLQPPVNWLFFSFAFAETRETPCKNDTVQCFTLVHVLHSHMTYLCDQAIIVSAGADTMPAIECLIIVQ